MAKRKPMKSVYTEAYDNIVRLYQEKNNYLTVEQVQEAFESTPELVFPSRTTVQEVISKLERWKLIAFLKPVGLEEKVVIPLNVD